MDRYREWKIKKNNGTELEKLLKKYPDKPWDWSRISYNPNITFDIIQANPDKPWDWSRISYNPNITFDIIQANPDKPWDWFVLSYNPNITLDIIKANPDKPWDWYELSRNRFIYDDVVCGRSMLQDIKLKHDFIVSGTGMVPDLAEIVASYCSFC
jgi:hypothetical protein